MFEKLTVSSDFTEDEKMEIENIRMYKKDLLEDIQVRQANAHMEQTSQELRIFINTFIVFFPVQKLKLEIDNVMATIHSFESAEEK